MKRQRLGALGRKRKPDYVVWFREPVRGVLKIRVQWRPIGETSPRTESFADTRKGLADAKSFAEGVHEELQQRRSEAPTPISLRSLLEKHIASKTTEWAANTLRLLKWRWGKLELHVGRSFPAHMLTREHLDALKNALLEHHAPNQVRLAIKAVTSVFRWGVDRDLIPPTKVTGYTARFAKEIEQRAPKMAEYSAGERRSLAEQFNPRDARQWRPFVATVVMAQCGTRADAALAVRWDDIDFDAKTVLWRAENDKTGRDRVQPLPEPVVEALHVAYGWAFACGYSGSFVFFRPGAGVVDRGSTSRRKSYATARSLARAAAKPDKPWTYQAYIAQLRKAEATAGIKYIKYRGAHGHRRGVAGDVHSKTGSSKTAADWIGDKSTRVVEKHYLLTRDDELRKVADIVGEGGKKP